MLSVLPWDLFDSICDNKLQFFLIFFKLNLSLFIEIDLLFLPDDQ